MLLLLLLFFCFFYSDEEVELMEVLWIRNFRNFPNLMFLMPSLLNISHPVKSQERAFKNQCATNSRETAQTLHALSFLNDEESGTNYPILYCHVVIARLNQRHWTTTPKNFFTILTNSVQDVQFSVLILD